jgi:hypothetical protein
MHCERASKIWFGSKLNIKFNNTHSSFSDWLIYVLKSLKEDQLNYLASLTYSIWYARNQHVFNQIDIEDTETISRANSSIQDYILATANSTQNQPSNGAGSINNQHHQSATARAVKMGRAIGSAQ